MAFPRLRATGRSRNGFRFYVPTKNSCLIKSSRPRPGAVPRPKPEKARDCSGRSPFDSPQPPGAKAAMALRWFSLRRLRLYEEKLRLQPPPTRTTSRREAGRRFHKAVFTRTKDLRAFRTRPKRCRPELKNSVPHRYFRRNDYLCSYGTNRAFGGCPVCFSGRSLRGAQLVAGLRRGRLRPGTGRSRSSIETIKNVLTYSSSPLNHR